MLVIGIGNRDRGDDAAGLIAARRLRQLGVNARDFEGDALSLAGEWKNDDDIVLIDAVATGSAAGVVHTWNLESLPSEKYALRVSTHGFSLLDALEISNCIGRRPRSARIFGIEASNFEPGAMCSKVVRKAAVDLAARLARGEA